MQLKMTNGDSILLICWTDKFDEKKEEFEEKHIHLVLENNHLLICDNGWKKMLIKSIKYPTKKGSMINTHKGLKEKLLKKAGKRYDEICIDLLSNDWCDFMKSSISKMLRKEKKVKNEKLET